MLSRRLPWALRSLIARDLSRFFDAVRALVLWLAGAGGRRGQSTAFRIVFDVISTTRYPQHRKTGM